MLNAGLSLIGHYQPAACKPPGRIQMRFLVLVPSDLVREFVRRSPPNSNRAENAARSISGGSMTSTPCPLSEASIAVCCFDLIARVMVKTTAWRIGRPSASSSSATRASARTEMVASNVVARIGVSTRSDCEIARETSRDATPSRSTITTRPSASSCFSVRTISDFSHVRPNEDARRQRCAVCPDADGSIWVAVQNCYFCSGVGQLSAQDDGGGRLPCPTLRRRDSHYRHLPNPICEETGFSA